MCVQRLSDLVRHCPNSEELKLGSMILKEALSVDAAKTPSSFPAPAPSTLAERLLVRLPKVVRQ